MTFRVLDLAGPDRFAERENPSGVVVAHGDSRASADDRWLEQASFALTETEVDDVRWVQVPSVPAALEELEDRLARWSQAAAVCDDVLRAVARDTPTLTGIVTESLAYSTLQAGSEFKGWLAGRGRATCDDSGDPVLIERTGDQLDVRLNRPRQHNAFSNRMRAALLDALEVANTDTSIVKVVLSGAGPSFCSGGDLAEFGTLADPVSAHLARTRHSPALALDSLARRLKRDCQARIHGHVLGSGLEMAAFCGHVVCRPDTVLGLPELRLGLIPGAGGTVSVTRRIGRWRTAYLVLTGRTVDAATALRWGLVDAVETADERAPATPGAQG
ncbi:enoyl-CoA hydratase/isomerase family protein [Mycobacterium yunnanensis]|uniref:Enoyl-CoA hydratase/isomerase family protein n=1 Tax=Mycobacterium yunnanensis TaxID=368477 RepID=A0A9X2YPI2_9MYCO|nr:enoyl-CoA hydratase/isomerase family protein [Mycobacterium yunnanensis]MCV7423222.1 enoyl-CoA hydratase/isomerase family protein [Mycobacterium yunnanensis]